MRRPETAPDASSAGTPLHRLPAGLLILFGALVLSAFLTQTKFVPTIKNNVGAFEITGGILLGLFLLTTPPRDVRMHPLTRIALAMACVAALSQVNIPDNRVKAGLVNVMILIFFWLFLWGLENLSRRYEIHPVFILRLVAWSLMIIGPWIILEGLQSEGDIQAAGPFRNRAHMANYMLSAFWMVLAYSQTPGLPRRERWVGFVGMGMTLYAIAVSGRRSVYLSLFLGLLGLVGAFLVLGRGRRARLLAAAVFALVVLGGMYGLGPRYLPQMAFFQERVGMIDDRLQSAVMVDEEDIANRTFFATQRQGVKAAFLAHPLIGIGWGGYAKSHWSPDQHEVHSTPLRFVAETGLAGVALYGAFMGVLWLTVWRIFLRLRGTPWAQTGAIFLVGLSSLCVSYLYNRHITERTFWLLAAVILALEIALERSRAATRRAPAAVKEARGATSVGGVPARS